MALPIVIMFGRSVSENPELAIGEMWGERLTFGD